MSGEILFVHAARVSLTATQRALRERPGLNARHALGESLVDPAAATFEPGERDYERLRAFVRGELGEAARVGLSCSVYNGFAERLSADARLPVERSDEAGSCDAARYERVGLAVSYPPSYELIRARLARDAASDGRAIEIVPLITGNPFARATDAAAYERVLIEAAAGAQAIDAIFLAQYSMDPYRAAVASNARVPVVSALERTLARLTAGSYRTAAPRSS